ncbi:Uncharacterised protein [Mycobacteroides abscessus subsp. abscessus]|nr:Uncharacterised protein [Mycobacteroides abscessus subsp. abscessus]
MPLGPGPLTVGALMVAGGHVVADRVPQDVLRGARGGHVLTRPTDHDGQFAFVMHLGCAGRQLDRQARPDDGGIRLDEDHRRLGRVATHFGGVGGVVLAHRDNLARQDGCQQPDIRERPLPSGKGGGAEGMLGDLAGDR